MKTIEVETESLLKEISTHDNSSIFSEGTKWYTKRKYKSYGYIFPIIYFGSSILFLLMLLVSNMYAEKSELGTYPLAGYHIASRQMPFLYVCVITVITITGFLNLWFLCALLMQRFSVPELKLNKPLVSIMFFIGTFGNIIFTFFGFAHKLMEMEDQRVPISLSVIIFSSFIFFNLLSSVCALKVLNNFRIKICKTNKRLRRSIMFKRYTLLISVLFIIFYLAIVGVKFYNKINKTIHFTNVINMLLFTIPFILFVFNAFINLTYTSDILIIEESINIIVDKEFFLNNDSDALLLDI